jgi:hypothetical protein
MVHERAVRRTARLLAVLVLVGCTDSPGTPPPSVAASVSAPAGSSVPAPPDVSVAPGQQLPPPPAGGFGAPVTVRFDGAPPLRAEVASRRDQRARGLMQRRELPAGTGMIFLFPKKSSGGFWMLGTLVPLSIAYVDGDTVVSTAEMVPCTKPNRECPSYPSTGGYTAAVEAPAGFFPDHGVGPGTKMHVDGALPAPS